MIKSGAISTGSFILPMLRAYHHAPKQPTHLFAGCRNFESAIWPNIGNPPQTPFATHSAVSSCSVCERDDIFLANMPVQSQTQQRNPANVSMLSFFPSFDLRGEIPSRRRMSTLWLSCALSGGKPLRGKVVRGQRPCHMMLQDRRNESLD